MANVIPQVIMQVNSFFEKTAPWHKNLKFAGNNVHSCRYAWFIYESIALCRKYCALNQIAQNSSREINCIKFHEKLLTNAFFGNIISIIKSKHKIALTGKSNLMAHSRELPGGARQHAKQMKDHPWAVRWRPYELRKRNRQASVIMRCAFAIIRRCVWVVGFYQPAIGVVPQK